MDMLKSKLFNKQNYNLILRDFQSLILDIDDCAPNPCQNDGSCTDGVDSHNCTCVAGFSGTDCEIG